MIYAAIGRTDDRAECGRLDGDAGRRLHQYGTCSNGEDEIKPESLMKLSLQENDGRMSKRDIALFSIFVGTVLIIFFGVITCEPALRRDTAIEPLFSGTTSLRETIESRSFSPKEERHQRSLLLLRHAKSSWDDQNLSDFDRPLQQRGLEDARRLGRFLYVNDVEPPQLIFSSPSVRTRQTLASVRSFGWADNVPVVFVDQLYDFEILDEDAIELYSLVYRDFVRTMDSRYERVMLVGHNPAIHGLAQQLLLPDKFISKFRPATFCEVYWDQRDINEWNTIKDGEGNLGMFLQPSDTK